LIIKLEHRGAVSADGRTGDGAGILLIFLMIFLKVCDFTIPKRASMQEWFSTKKKNQADFARRLLKLLFAIKI
jgi:glutamate synthase (ferredoxin)